VDDWKITTCRRGRPSSRGVSRVPSKRTLSAIETCRSRCSRPTGHATSATSGGRLLDEVGMTPRGTSYPNTLSGGERSGSRSPAPWPTSRACSWPTSDREPRQRLQEEVLNLLKRLRRERGLTLIVVTHSPEVAAEADRIIAPRREDRRGVIPRDTVEPRPTGSSIARGS